MFDPDKYEPSQDSNPEYADRDTSKVVLVVGSGLCNCGCGLPVQRLFRPGHDARLKGRLIRAAVTNTRILLVDPESGKTKTTGVMDIADAISQHSPMDWSDYVQRGADRVMAELVAAEARATAKAEQKAEDGLAVRNRGKHRGATVKAKVGRWVYEGHLEQNGCFVYTTKRGSVEETMSYQLIED